MSADAAALLGRLKASATQLRLAANQTPDLLTSYVNSGVQAEVVALAPLAPVTNTNVTKEEYIELIAVFTQFNNFWTNAAVTTQDNRLKVQQVFDGG